MVPADDSAGAVLARPPRRIRIECVGPFERGLKELRPKRLNHVKLVATLVRQLSDKDPTRPASSATVLMPLVGGEAEAILDLLPDVPRLTLGAPLFQSALDQIAGVSGRTILAALGDAEPPEGDAHQALARALVTHDPLREQRLGERLIRGAPMDPKAEHLVVEERAGRALILDLERPSIRHAARRWEPGRDSQTRAPFATPAGFGAGALMVSNDVDSTGGRVLSVASLDWRPPGGVLSLDSMRTLHDACEQWLASLGLGIAALRRIIVSAPWLSVSEFIGRGLTPRDILDHPDQLYGWQPLLTLLAFLGSGESPALLVYSGRHSTIHLVAIWS